MRDLGVFFCDIEPSKLSDDQLNAKSQKGVVGRPASKKPKMSKDLEASTSKQNKATTKKFKKPSKNDSDQGLGAEPSEEAKN